MKCPSCDTLMDRHDRHGVQIEHCPACGGVWLDRGELERLLETVRQPVALRDPEPVRPEPESAGRGAREPAPKPRQAERFEARAGAAAPRPGESRRYGGKHSRKVRIKDLLDEIFDFD